MADEKENKATLPSNESLAFENDANGTATAADTVPEPALPVQTEMPFAVVQGKQLTEIPQDLYIPPEALEVFLSEFEGPLDLLLYLIRRQNLDILDIDVFVITQQYMQYIEAMNAVQFELAAEYLVMAAMLAEIKSRMLLPRLVSEDEEEEDPRALLIRRLQEYEQFKQAAHLLDELPRVDRDIYVGHILPPDAEITRPESETNMDELMLAFAGVLKRADNFKSHQISAEKLSTRERMTKILSLLSDGEFHSFISLFAPEEGRLGVVVTFLATMELVKESLIDIVQEGMFAAIHVKVKTQSTALL